MCVSVKLSWLNWGVRWTAFLMKPISAPGSVCVQPPSKVANKRLSTKTGKGNRWLRQGLIEAANAAAHSKGTFLGAYYQQLRKRMGHKKAIVALAHRILVIIYHLLFEQQAYRELGPDHVDEKAAEVARRQALRTLEQLGYDVTLQSSEVA